MARIKQMFKKAIFSCAMLHTIVMSIRNCRMSLCSRSGLIIENQGYARIKKDIEGTGHTIMIGKDSKLYDTKIRMHGRNNTITFEDNCVVGPECSFWLEGSDISIAIGAGTTFTLKVHLNAQEDGTSIKIGNDCMFSNTITVRTSDSHPIYDSNTGKRLNKAKSVVIGNHVWVAPCSRIMKGATIGDGAIIGSDTIVTKDVAHNTLVVGHPARVVKTNIEWTSDVLF